MDQIKLVKLLELLKKHRVTKYKDQEIELELDYSSQDEERVGPPGFQQISPTAEGASQPPTKQPTEEEFLYWSAGFDPSEIKAEPPKQ